VIANRLTENEDISVLVLEAGSNRIKDPRITVPGLSSALYGNPEFDWMFRSVPQIGLLVFEVTNVANIAPLRNTSMVKSLPILAARQLAAPAPSTSSV